MDHITELREQVKQQLEEADEKTLRMIQAMLEVAVSGDWWDTLPEDVQAEIDKSIEQLDKGEGIPHEKVKEMYPQWFKQ